MFFCLIFREENPGEFFEQLFKFRGSTDIHTDLGGVIFHPDPGSTISTNRYHDKINPKNCQVLSLGDSGFLQFFRVVSRDSGKPRDPWGNHPI